MIIGLALPTHDDVKTDCALSLLATNWSPHQIAILNVRTPYVTMSRRLLVKKALERNCDVIFFVDSDICFPPDAFQRLVAHDKDIVGAIYSMRQPPYKLVGTGLVGEREISPTAKGLIRMHKMPGGFMLIRMDVFRTIPEPWYTFNWIPELNDYEPEDYAFCSAARKAGYDLWCDLDLSHELVHIGQKGYQWS